MDVRAAPTVVQSGRPPAQAGRSALLTTMESRLAANGSVVLTGPSGIGKTALLEAAGAAADARGELVLRAAGTETERWVPCSGLAELLDQLPPQLIGELPRERLTGLPEPHAERPVDHVACKLTFRGLLARCAEERPVLLLVDDAQWLDAESADAVRYAVGRLAVRGVRAVVAGRWPDGFAAGDGGSAPWAPAPGALHLPVPPLGPDELAEMFDRYGLPVRVVNTLHSDSGGNPYLALALGGAFTDRIPGTGGGAAAAARPVGDRRAAGPAAGRGARDAADGGARDPSDDRPAVPGRTDRRGARHPPRRRPRAADHRGRRCPVHAARRRDRPRRVRRRAVPGAGAPGARRCRPGRGGTRPAPRARRPRPERRAGAFTGHGGGAGRPAGLAPDGRRAVPAGRRPVPAEPATSGWNGWSRRPRRARTAGCPTWCTGPPRPSSPPTRPARSGCGSGSRCWTCPGRGRRDGRGVRRRAGRRGRRPGAARPLRLRMALSALVNGAPGRAEHEANGALAHARATGDTALEAKALAVRANIALIEDAATTPPTCGVRGACPNHRWTASSTRRPATWPPTARCSRTAWPRPARTCCACSRSSNEGQARRSCTSYGTCRKWPSTRDAARRRSTSPTAPCASPRKRRSAQG